MTGASGFIGRHVVAEALRRGHFVSAMVRPATPIRELPWADQERVTLVRLDLRSERHLTEVLLGIETVVHLAVAGWRETVVTTENLLRAMDAAKCTSLVLVSSFAVYDYDRVPPFGLLDETSPLERRPERRDAYCHAKLVQEELAREWGTERGRCLCVLRPGSVIGGNDAWTPRVGIQMTSKWWIRIGAWARLPLSYVENCAEAIVHCAEHRMARGETFNIVDDDLPTQRRYSRRLQKLTRPQPHILPLPWPLLLLTAWLAVLANRALLRGRGRLPQLLRPPSLSARCKPLRYTNRKLREKLDWRPRFTLEEALGRIYRTDE